MSATERVVDRLAQMHAIDWHKAVIQISAWLRGRRKDAPDFFTAHTPHLSPAEWIAVRNRARMARRRIEAQRRRARKKQAREKHREYMRKYRERVDG